MTDKRLDEALKKWAGQRGADRAHLDRLAGTIQDRLRGQVFADSDEEGQAVRRRRPLWGRFGLVGLGAAAALLIAWLAGILAPPRADSDVKKVSREFGTISASEARTSARLFRETELLFDGAVRWVANTDTAFRVGLGRDRAAFGAGDRPLLVRVVVLRRNAGRPEWRRVWRADVLARAEDRIDVPAEAGFERGISLWLYPMADGSVLVDSRVEMAGPDRTSYETSGVLKPGRPSPVLSVRRNGDEYEVLQTVVDLARSGS